MSTPEGWREEDGALVREFELESFPAAIEFVRRLADLAESEDHHPDIDIRYRRVVVRFTTHSAGGDETYDRLPFFYSDLFDLGYEAVGELDSRQRTVEVWQEPARKGVVAFVDDESRPRGVLLWNVWDKLDAARDLLRAGEGALAV